MTDTSKRLWLTLRGAFFLLALTLTGAPSLRASQQVLRFDPAKTQIEFLLGAGMHDVEGTASLSHGEIVFDLSTGKASGEVVASSTSADTASKKRDKKMHKKVLESETYPEIAFYPQHIEGSLKPEGESEVRITGIFMLHGDKHQISMPTRVQVNGNHITGTATFNIPYVSWGLKDPSLFVFRVHKDVNVTLNFTGTLDTVAAKSSSSKPTQKQASR